jgi:hypothetical protein
VNPAWRQLLQTRARAARLTAWSSTPKTTAPPPPFASTNMRAPHTPTTAPLCPFSFVPATCAPDTFEHFDQPFTFNREAHGFACWLLRHRCALQENDTGDFVQRYD